jgi:hypothetical protein
MSDADPTTTQAFSGRTAWARHLERPMREFLATETGSAAVLLAATLVALVWVNADSGSYDSLWGTMLVISVGGHGVALDLREWVNSGLMAFFFFVVGLEARREFDIGELRERRRVTLPLVAGIGGMAVPVLIYLAFNAGRGWAGGAPRCPRIRRSLSACWRSSDRASPTACARSCSPWSWWTTSPPSS